MLRASWYRWVSEVGYLWICAGLIAALILWLLSRRVTALGRARVGVEGAREGAHEGREGDEEARARAAALRAQALELKREALNKVEALLRGVGAPVVRGATLLSKERGALTSAELVAVVQGVLWVIRVEAWEGYLRGEGGEAEWQSAEWEGKGAARVERLTPRPNALRAHDPYLEVLRLVAHGKATREAQVVSALVIVGGEPRLKGLKGHERALSLPQLRAHLKGEGAPVSPESREAAQGLWRRLRQLSEELGARGEVAV